MNIMGLSARARSAAASWMKLVSGTTRVLGINVGNTGSTQGLSRTSVLQRSGPVGGVPTIDRPADGTKQGGALITMVDHLVTGRAKATRWAAISASIGMNFNRHRLR